MRSYSMQHITKRLGQLTFAAALAVAMRKAAVTTKLKSGEKLTDEELSVYDVHGPAHFLANTAFKLGPVALTTTLTTNIFNPGTTTGGVACTSAPFDKLYVIFRRFGIVNKTGSAATASLWIGATGGNAAGTEFWVLGQSVPANSYIQWNGYRRFGQADFLVGGAGTTTALTLDGDGEIGIGA